jgi:hypothetical protein
MTLTDTEEQDRRDDQLEARLQSLGTRRPQCSIDGCREQDPFALTGAAPNIICQEHRLQARGQMLVEKHHVAGAHNDPTAVPLPANEHAAASAHQQRWPSETLRNPRESPLLRAAAWIRGWLDLLRVVIDRGIGRIPTALERLDLALTEWHGAEWWEVLGWSW